MRLTKEQLIADAVKRIKSIERDDGDQEEWHIKADHILVDLLNKLGCSEVTEAWKEIPKWYA